MADIGRREKAARALLSAILDGRAEPKQVAAAIRITNNPRGLPRGLVEELKAAANPAVDELLRLDQTGEAKLGADESCSLVRALAGDASSDTKPVLIDFTGWKMPQIDAAIWLCRHREKVECDRQGFLGVDRDAWLLACTLLPLDKQELLSTIVRGMYER